MHVAFANIIEQSRIAVSELKLHSNNLSIQYMECMYRLSDLYTSGILPLSVCFEELERDLEAC